VIVAVVRAGDGVFYMGMRPLSSHGFGPYRQRHEGGLRVSCSINEAVGRLLVCGRIQADVKRRARDRGTGSGGAWPMGGQMEWEGGLYRGQRVVRGGGEWLVTCVVCCLW
jgi:hypothetical protein